MTGKREVQLRMGHAAHPETFRRTNCRTATRGKCGSACFNISFEVRRQRVGCLSPELDSCTHAALHSNRGHRGKMKRVIPRETCQGDFHVCLCIFLLCLIIKTWGSSYQIRLGKANYTDNILPLYCWRQVSSQKTTNTLPERRWMGCRGTEETGHFKQRICKFLFSKWSRNLSLGLENCVESPCHLQVTQLLCVYFTPRVL